MFKSKAILVSAFLGAALLSSCASQPGQESTGQFIDSSVITAKVKAKILSDDAIKSQPISVKTYKDTVQLSGFVNSQAQRLKAGQDARSVNGVQKVQNLIVIKSH